MVKVETTASLSGLIDMDMEGDTIESIETDPSPGSNQENAPPTKRPRGRGRGAGSRPTKAAKAPTTRSRPARVNKPAPKKKNPVKRTPLTEQRNEQHASDTEEIDDLAREEGVKATQARKPDKAVPQPKKLPQKKVVEQARATVNDEEFEYTPTRQNRLHPMRGSAVQIPTGRERQGSTEQRQMQYVVPETQAGPMDIDQLESADDAENLDEIVPQSEIRQAKHARANSRQPQPSVIRRRFGSVSDTERANGDPESRRRLGEMTRKFENLDSKYKNLRETGIKEADANLERLKAQVEAKTKVTNDVISSLEKELVAQKSLALECQSLQEQIASQEADIVKTQALANQLSTSLSEAQNENKSLQAKLANSRSTPAAVEHCHAKSTGSASHNNGSARATVAGGAEAAHAAQVPQLKEDLYSDLTGLILRGVERASEADVYDCIQTGRNGTLHFKLAVANETGADRGSYDDTEFIYTPCLDSNRDRALLELLPDYLTEEITFSRINAEMFYGRVVDTLTTKAR